MEEVEEISSMADRIDRIIKHMRALARSRESLDLGPCDLNRIVGQALDFMGSQLAAHGIRVRSFLEDELPLVLGTHTGLEEAMINLLANAMQALDLLDNDNKVILIRTGHDANVVLEISDNGPGSNPKSWKRFSIRFSPPGDLRKTWASACPSPIPSSLHVTGKYES